MTIKPFDIETIPNMDMIPYLPDPEVKLGNLVDPKKIFAKEEEARKKQLENMGLNALYSRVFCASFGNGCGMIIEELTDEKEAELIDWIFEQFSGGDVRLQTYNGNHFDIPFVFKRAMMLKVDMTKYNLPSLAEYTKKYNNDLHEDLMLHFPTSERNKFMKLNAVSMALLGESKIDIDFKFFRNMMLTAEGRAEILEYCHKDADLTAEIGELASKYLFN